MDERLTEEQQNEAERLVFRVLDVHHDDYQEAFAGFVAICDQADAARRFLALTETGPDYAAAGRVAKPYLAPDMDGWSDGWQERAIRKVVDAALADYPTEDTR